MALTDQSFPTHEKWIEALDSFGRRCWELVAIIRYDEFSTAYFKRPVE